ncbi:ABC transporter ATP-binding protein [Nocardia brasiliensis]|uniref:ABC transporter ATP-binding protein n=1 Tax=Nocardia brasiliensis TaxID=37326 RepID=UPI00142D3F40|nr:ABC transporter ATP-binding protein [Nocardia brasiliensis]
MTLDSTVVRNAIGSSLVQILTGTITLVGTVAVMIFLDWMLFSIVFVTIAVAAGAMLLVMIRIETASTRLQESVGALSADIERALTAVRTVKVNNAEDREHEHLTELASAAYAVGVRAARLKALGNPATHLAVMGSFVVSLLVGGVRVANHQMELSNLVTMMLLAMNLLIPVGDLFNGSVGLQQALGALNRIQATLTLSAEDDIDDVPACETPYQHNERQGSSTSRRPCWTPKTRTARDHPSHPQRMRPTGNRPPTLDHPRSRNRHLPQGRTDNRHRPPPRATRKKPGLPTAGGVEGVNWRTVVSSPPNNAFSTRRW